MLLVLSPAKTLDLTTPAHVADATQPLFLAQASELIAHLRALSPAAVASLLQISDRLAVRNVMRYAAWTLPFTADNAKQAALTFHGDVYAGLQAWSLSRDDLLFAQQHLRILSGLYGVLRPLDLMQAYRLEMGTRLATERGKDLYAFWGERIGEALAEAMRDSGASVLVNLASEEYFKAVSPPTRQWPIVQPVFEDWSNGRYRVISFYAKRARGAMARFAIVNRLREPAALRAFAADGYAYAPAASHAAVWVFRRRLSA